LNRKLTYIFSQFWLTHTQNSRPHLNNSQLKNIFDRLGISLTHLGHFLNITGA